ncbi:MAG: PAS domain-containing protein, partial [Acidimicrobiia bacterium]|nr:PAS domain-containing protein [Acidimicrobiia bacterium]
MEPPYRAGSSSLFVVGAVLTILYVLVPTSTTAEIVLYDGVTVGAAVALAYGAWRRPRAERSPWVMLAAGNALLAMGEVTWTVLALLGRDPYPSIADGLYLCGYPILAAGVIQLGNRQSAVDRSWWLDAALVTASAGLVTWAFVVRPHAMADAAPWFERVVTLAYPLMDLLLLAASAGQLFRAGRRPASHRLLATGFWLMLGADLWHGVAEANGTYGPGGVLDALWLLAYLSIATAALQHDRPLGPGGPAWRGASLRPAPARLGVIVLSALLPAAVTMWEVLGPDEPDRAVLTGVALTSAFVVAVTAKRALGVIGVAVELSERRSEQRHEALIENATDVVVVVDAAGSATYVSPVAELRWGHPPGALLGRPFVDLVHPSDRLAVHRLL